MKVSNSEKKQDAKNAAGPTIPATTAARLIMVEPEELAKLVRAGWFKPIKGQYRLVDLVQGHIRYLEHKHRRTGRTAAEAAAAIDMGQRRFFELLDNGTIQRKSRDGYDVDEVVRDYIRSQRKVAAGRGSEPSIDLAAERALLAREQTEMVALKNAIARREVVAVADVIMLVEGEYVVVRQRLLTIPGKLAEPLLNQTDRTTVFGQLQEEITEALHELSEPADIAQRAARAGGAIEIRDAIAQTATEAQPH